jgi:hypothetical protein
MEQFDKKDQKSRKFWLISAICYFSITAIYILIDAFFLQKESLSGLQILTILVLCVLVNFVPFYLVYHCAYKRFGTKLLMVVLILGPTRMVHDIVMTIENSSALSTYITLIFGALFLVYWYACLKLRKVNKGFKTKTLVQEYTQALLSMREAINLESLDMQFSALIKRWPQNEKISSEEYNSLKAALLQKI